MPHKTLDSAYDVFSRIFLGAAPPRTQSYPPAWLWVLWLVAFASWIYPSTLSLWEDEIWMLVVSVDQPWHTVLGFTNYYSGNHVLYSILSRILIKAAGHHWIEFVYRVPSLIAGILLLPMSFAVLNRCAGRFCALAGSTLFCLLPAIIYHASNARGYMWWCFLTLWTTGLLLNKIEKKSWFRIACAYFLLGISHPLALITLAGFGIFGVFLTEGPTIKRWLGNALICLPAALYSIPAIQFIYMYHKIITGPISPGPLSRFSFIPKIMESYFGSPFFEGISAVFFALALVGAARALRASTNRGLALIGLALIMPLAFIASGDPFSFDRCFMGSLPPWIILISKGFETLKDFVVYRLFAAFSPRARLIAFSAFFAGALFCLWAPKLWRYETCPKQDYRSCLRTVAREFPTEETVFSTSPNYYTGLSYYARRVNKKYYVLKTPREARDSLLQSSGARKAVVVAVEPGVSSEMLDWTNKNLMIREEWDGVNLSTALYVPRRTCRP